MKLPASPAIPALALAAALATVAPQPTLALDGEALLARVDEIRAPGENFRFDIRVESGDSSEAMTVSVKDRTKGLVRYVEPAKMKGRAILFVGKNMWVHVPGTRRALRISPRQRLFGGVSSADVARTVFSEDYEVAEATASGPGHVLRLSPRTKAAAYARIDLAIDDNAAPQTATFLSEDGRKLKTMTFGGYRDILGESRPTRLEVIDHLDGDAVTVMNYSGFERVETPDAWYQPGQLGRQ